MPCSSNFVCGNTKADINGWPVRFMDCDLINLYAHRVLGNSSPFLEVVKSSLATNRITYCKQTAGDCGGTGFSLGSQTQAELAAAGGLAQAAARDKEPISSTVLNIVGSIVGLFGQAHAQAVANEQTTLCKVADSWNSWAQAIEYGLSSGNIALQDAINQLQQVYQTLSSTAGGVAKNTTDAANYYKAALDALRVWNTEVVFPSLIPSPSLASTGTGLLAGVASALGLSAQPAGVSASGSVSVSTPAGGKLLLWAAIALVAFKLFSGRKAEA